MSTTLDVNEKETFIEDQVMSIWRQIFWTTSFLLVLGLTHQTTVAQPNRSVYTSLDAKQCRTIKSSS